MKLNSSSRHPKLHVLFQAPLAISALSVLHTSCSLFFLTGLVTETIAGVFDLVHAGPCTFARNTTVPFGLDFWLAWAQTEMQLLSDAA